MSESVAFDRAAEYYDQTRGFPSGVEKDVAALLVRVGKLNSASCVLEVGVGTGRIALPLAPHVGAYYGIDLARPMIDKMVEKTTTEPIYPVLGDITRLPFASHSFDAVTAVHIFHLVPGYKEALREVARVLKPGGALLHGWNMDNTDNAVMRVWNQTVEALGALTRSAPGTMMRSERETFMLANGWTTGAGDKFTFRFERAPGYYLTQLRKRVYSSQWQMSDEAHNAGIAALEHYFATSGVDPDQPEVIEGAFQVQAYYPPAE